MSHIANKIDATDKTLSEILTGERYRIDSFQREYRWQRKHIEALISDLSISFLSSFKTGDSIEDSISYDCYYMGPVVLCKDKNELSVVDGQQRLTSFSLLIIYLKHLQNEIELPDIELRNLRNYLYVRKAGKETLVLNVDSRKKVMEYLYDKPEEAFNQFDELEDQDESVINILSRYEDIHTSFPEELKEAEVLPLFIEWLLERVILVEVKAYSMENAYTIFETMNDRGMTLSPTEILKGYLLSKIQDEEKSDHANEFWKNRISEINRDTKSDGDLDFFRAWLRAKYAITTRGSKVGAKNEDFEEIATQFNAWIKNNNKKVYLKNSDDFYYFIVSDFDFFSELYMDIFDFKNTEKETFKELYVTNFYPIADSLSYPLLISPVLKTDSPREVSIKLHVVNKFIDVYTNKRMLSSKSITQSSIRFSMYEIIKEIRNLDIEELKIKLKNRLGDVFSQDEAYKSFQQMNNWGYYHYFFARILYDLHFEDEDFKLLMRSKKQNSYVLHRIFNEKDLDEIVEGAELSVFLNSVANFCLIRRYHLEEYSSKRNTKTKLSFLIKNDYLESSLEIENTTSPMDFIKIRDAKLKTIAGNIWNFD